jgi:hypothetical protein
MGELFGEFDPRFLGISLGVSSMERWEMLRRYAFGDKPLTERKAFRLDDDDFIEHTSCRSVIEHEFRHFHDFIISPYGSRMMHARWALAVNVQSLFAAIFSDEGSRSASVLPAPLSVWCRMPQIERESFLTDLSSAAADPDRQFIAPRMPFLSESGSVLKYQTDNQTAAKPISDAVEACSEAERALADLQALPEGIPPLTFGPTHFWEASAVLVQCQAILETIGPKSANRFMRILTGNPRNRYGRAIKLVLQAFELVGIGANTESMLTFVLWCLLGDPYDLGVDASPVARYLQLTRVLISEGSHALRSSIEQTYELWDRLTGNGPTLGSLRGSADRDQLFYDFMMQKIQETTLAEEGGVIQDLADLFSQFAGARRYLINQLLADPQGYSSPGRYLHSLQHLSSPPIKIVVEPGLGFQSPGNFEDGGWYLHAGKRLRSTGQPIGMIVSPSGAAAGIKHIDRKTAFDAYTLFTFADILFGPDIVDVPQSDWEITDDLLGELLGRPMSLFRINR